MTPADELAGAATKLRTLVADLGDNRGPWHVVNREQRPYPQRIDNIGVPYVVASTTTDPSHPPTIADYITTMHPGVGRALADWLNHEAEVQAAVEREQWTQTEPCGWCGNSHALAVARAVNGPQDSEAQQ